MSETVSASEATTISEDDALRALLAGRHIACPWCGHNLRGGDGRRCVECGKFIVPTLSLSRVALAPANPRLVARDWLRRSSAFTPGAAHLCLGASLGVACAREWWDGLMPASQAMVITIFHLVSGITLGALAFGYLRFRRADDRGARLVGFRCGALLCALTFVSLAPGVIIDLWSGR